MKNLIKVTLLYAGATVGSTIGMLGGFWLWGNVVEPAADKFKHRFTKSTEEEES